MRVYLAGKMGGRLGADVLEERYHASRILEADGLEVYDPAEGESICISSVIDIALDFATMRRFVSKDEYAIRHCDVLLVLTGDTPSEGTGIEIGLALSVHMPVILVSPKRVSGELMGFWNVKADAIFNTVEEAAEFIGEAYGGR